ncbi:MAG: ECF transporter S component [Erysipelotrichaceae bacterium]
MKNNQKTLFLTFLSLFIAIEFVLMFTPLGFVPLGVIRATTLHIPVIIAAIIMGKKGGAIVGFSFGFASFLINTLQPTITSFVFTPFYSVGDVSGNFYSLIIAFVPRILLGLAAYYLFKLLSKRLRFSTSVAITAFLSTLLHTILVLGGIYVFFGPQYAAVKELALQSLFAFLMGIVTTNGIMEAFLAAFVCSGVCVALKPFIKKLGGTLNG